MAMFNLALSGPTGSGKTTLSKMLENECNFDLVKEEIPHELFLKFQHNPKKYCFDYQKEIIKSRYKNYLSGINYIKIIDRTPDEDVEVFCALYNNLGFLSSSELKQLRNILCVSSSVIGHIDVTIYVTANANTLKSRLLKRGEPPILIDNLPLQLELYKNWENNNLKSIIEIDNTYLSLTNLDNIAELIAESIKATSFSICDFRKTFNKMIKTIK